MQTYFITCDGYVKIGKSGNAARRYASLQTATPKRLTLLLVIDGDLEKELHRKFHTHRFRGEWFTLAKDIQDFIDNTPGIPVVLPTLRVKKRKVLGPKPQKKSGAPVVSWFARPHKARDRWLAARRAAPVQ